MEVENQLVDQEVQSELHLAAERGVGILEGIEAAALQKSVQPHIELAYGNASSRERRDIHNAIFIAVQGLDRPESAFNWAKVVLSRQYMASMPMQIPPDMPHTNSLRSLHALVKDTPYYEELAELVRSRIKELIVERPADYNQWPWPLRRLVKHEICDILGGGSYADIAVRSHAGYFTEGRFSLFTQTIATGLSEPLQLSTVAEVVAQPLPGQRSGRAAYGQERPDRIAAVGCAATLLEHANIQDLTGATALTSASKAFWHTLDYLTRFGHGTNAQRVRIELQNHAGAVTLDERTIGLSGIVQVASQLTSKLEMPSGFRFPVFDQLSFELLFPAIDRLLFVSTQLGPDAAKYREDEGLRRVTTTMQRAIWALGNFVTREPCGVYSRADALAHYSLQMPPKEAKEAAREAADSGYLITPYR